MADENPYEEIPPFEGQTPQEVEDFERRGIAGVVLFENGERVEVRKTADNAKELRRIMQERRNRQGKV